MMTRNEVTTHAPKVICVFLFKDRVFIFNVFVCLKVSRGCGFQHGTDEEDREA